MTIIWLRWIGWLLYWNAVFLFAGWWIHEAWPYGMFMVPLVSGCIMMKRLEKDFLRFRSKRRRVGFALRRVSIYDDES